MLKYVSFAIPVRLESNGIFFYFQKRSEAGSLDGKLEFPGGKIEQGESPLQACKREVMEECGIELNTNEFQRFSIDQFEYSDRKVQLHSFILDIEKSNIKTDAFIEKFISFSDFEMQIKKLDILEANILILEKYMTFMIGQINE